MKRAYRLGVLVAGPPIVWAAQGLLGWWVTSRGCEEMPMLRLEAVRALMLVVSVIALGATIAGLIEAVGLVRAAPPDLPGDIDRVRFFGTVAVVVGSTLSLGVLFATLPSVLLTKCGGGHWL